MAASRKKKEPKPPVPQEAFLVMRLRRWEHLFSDNPQVAINVVAPEGSLGFIDVYDSMENAEAAIEEYDEPTVIAKIDILVPAGAKKNRKVAVSSDTRKRVGRFRVGRKKS